MGGGMDDFLYENTCSVLRAVNVNWYDDGWNVNANSVANPNRWNAGNQVFSRNYSISLTRLVGVFVFPTTLSSSHQAFYLFLPIPWRYARIFQFELTYFPMQVA